MTPSRIAHRLNRALHEAFARHPELFLLGEDVADPYGGAFKITRGLSTAYPERVLTTPLSENGVLGVANGLAMCGHRVIVEIMFGDFIGLAYDQILNLSSKSVSMYGERIPMSVIVRCPVGGRRGYGPTHSQSPQKHFIGIPHLALYELSPFHDISQLLMELLERDEPTILFEDKVTYTEPLFPGAEVDQRYQREFLGGGNWTHLHARTDTGRTAVALIAPGGVGRRALAAATTLSGEHGLDVHVLVPARLYPLDVDDVVDLLVTAEATWVAEESTQGGTWGAEVAARIHDAAWARLRAPVRLISSADSVIPAAPHLERNVLLQAETIVQAVGGQLRGRAVSRNGGPCRSPTAEKTNARPATPTGRPVLVPKVNSNDDCYLLIGWLVPTGQLVKAGQPIAEVETSKATDELVANAEGVLHHAMAVGAECRPGDVIGHIAPTPLAPEGLPGAPISDATARAHPLSRSQQEVAKVVATSHREIPAAFAVVRIVVDEVLTVADAMSQRSGAEIGLTEIVVKALGALHTDHPLLYGTLQPDGTVSIPDAVGVAVTVDVGTGLYLPVVPNVASRSLDDIADCLTDLRMRALRGQLTERNLAEAAIALSLNTDDGIVLACPIIPPGMAAIVSLAATHEQPCLAGSELTLRKTVEVSLAHDHRFINGRDANIFLGGIKNLLEHPSWLERT